ncbi:MAG: ATP-binding protein [Christensenellaceae bacterium]|jgi:predicted AAA+ superfamily ATPase
MKEYADLLLKLNSLALFHSLTENTAFQKLYFLLSAPNGDMPAVVSAYAAFASVLMDYEMDISVFVRELVLNDQNPYTSGIARGKMPSQALRGCLESELGILAEVACLKSADVKAHIGYAGYLPDWSHARVDLLSLYDEEMAGLHTRGFGIFKRYHMFTVNGGALVPVKTPDGVRLGDLYGYEYERGLILQNTNALLAGKPAANMLLYGDSGTGKSSSIKAVANELCPKGLRLVEVPKANLFDIPGLIETLSDNPLKFILFIDDLSFSGEDDNFTALKAILEGSVLSRSSNTVIYATSNRRRLVKESFSDRKGDDLHINETIQQTASLSERFGLAIPFSAPSKEEYLEIVSHLAGMYQISLAQEALHQQAEVFALEKGGRSGRAARQFIEQLVALQAAPIR